MDWIEFNCFVSFRPTYPVRPHGFPGTDSYPSHGPGLAPKPSHGTTSAPAKQQALKTKMDIWRDTLRKRRWTPPRPPPLGDSALAHRKRCNDVFWLLIKVNKKIALSKLLLAGSFEQGDESPVSLIAIKYTFTNCETTKFSGKTLQRHI
jgi:hypothetical protein